MAPPPPSSSRRSCRQQEPHLPDECWELVFKHLSNPLDHESLSLVSRHFLSLTNRLHTDLAVVDLVLPLLPALLSRFPNLTTIKITRCFTGNINALLSQIASFDLPSLHSLELTRQRTFPSRGLRQFSQKFPTLKSLKCFCMRYNLGLIVECFPNLEEIDLSHPLEIMDLDFLAKVLTSGLRKLRRLNILANCKVQDSSSIFILYQSCKFLEDHSVLITDLYGGIPEIDIANAIRERPQLSSLSLHINRLTSRLMNENLRSDNVTLVNALVSLKGLTCLDLSYSNLSSKELWALAEGLPLRKLSLRCW